MFSFISSLFWRATEPTNSILSLDEAYNIINEEEKENTDVNEKSIDENKKPAPIENFQTCTKTGIITKIVNDIYTIDNLYTFKSELNVAIGTRITYQLMKNCGVIDVVDVQVIDSNWDVSENSRSNWCNRTLICSVIKREKRIIFLAPGDIRINLNIVSSNFVPVVGDWVELQVICEVDEKVSDLSGKILEVTRISPSRPHVITGNITAWNFQTQEGTIDRNVYFNKNSLYCGYSPRRKQEVVAEIIESTQGNCTWRAIKVIPSYLRLKEKRNKPVNSLDELEDELLEDHESLNITNDIIVTMNKLNDMKQFWFEVENISRDKVFMLFDVKFLHPHGQCSILTEIEGFELKSGMSLKINGECLARVSGQSREIIVLNFGEFKIKRWITINVGDINKTKKSNYIEEEKSKTYKIFNDGSNRQLQRGEKPFYTARFSNYIPEYSVPERLLKIFERNLTNRDYAKTKSEIETIKPVVRSTLDFMNYEDKFHTLIHLDEIHAIMAMHEYDRPRACFIRNGEYLMFEIENLAEKRPSIIVGDRVIARDINDNNKPDYEGFVHQVGKDHLYIKFSRLFHESYNGDDYAITLKAGRTQYKRQHHGITLAIKNLGRDILFPFKVVEREPQVTFVYDNYSNASSPNDKTKQNSLNKLDILTNLRELQLSTKKQSKILKLEWFNKSFNYYQKEAVRNALLGVCRPLPYLIFGPPGTGKTVTVVEIVLQILRLIPQSRILLAAPSNSAADLLASRLIDSEVLQPGDLIRLVAFSAISSISAKLAPYSATISIEREGTETSIATVTSSGLTLGLNSAVIGRHRVTVCTCITAGGLYQLGFPKGHFTHIIVDEAGQTSEPDLMIPMSFLDSKKGQVILAGDPMQLGPVILSPLAKTYGLEESYLERLICRFPYIRDPEGFEKTTGYDPRLVTKLIYNYRSLPVILKLPSLLFYNDDLLATISETDSEQANILRQVSEVLPKGNDNKSANIIFHGVKGENFQTEDSPSWYNPQEAAEVFRYVNDFYRMGLKNTDIGIITPYKAQAKHLVDLYQEAEFDIPKIGTVEEFQGQEYNVVILSTVRSSKSYLEADMNYKLGFICNPRRLNVSITRAKAILIIIGNPFLLRTDGFWRSVINYCEERGTYVGYRAKTT